MPSHVSASLGQPVVSSPGRRPVPPRLVSVVIVSYNTRELLRRSLLSALNQPLAARSERAPAVECLVVDNASHDGSADMVARDFPQVLLLRSTENRGFAWAVNRGLERTGAEYLLLLNPDAELLDDALERMVDFMAAHPRVAAVGPQLLYGDGSRQHAAFSFPTLPMIFLDFFPLHGRLLNSRLNGRYPPATGAHPIGHPLGACMLLRREAVQAVGPFDEQFFMYCEEVDWCLRAQQSGWQVYHLPQAMARHLGGQSAGQRRNAMFVELHRSRLRLYRKHYSLFFCWLAESLTRLGLWAEARRARREAAQGRLPPEALAERLAALDQVRALLGHGS